MAAYTLDKTTRVWVRNDYESKIDYSDGAEVERQLFEIVQNSIDISSLSDELEAQIFNWPSQYFFSKQRANLLRPFASLFKGKNILEPGCGAGTISRFLGESDAMVTAVETTMPRARIAAERCRDLPNVKIVCDDIGSFESDEKFDGIVVVGLLEYATRYSNEKDAPLQFLLHLKQFVKEDGFIITAIENQLGLKYFSGFLEDHIGLPMHGINNNYQPGQATTWGRKTLIELFEHAGFTSNQLFLPFPDYKLPSLMVYPNLYQKKTIVDLANIFSAISYQDPQPSTPLFSLDKALPLIAQNGLLYDLGNSFCLFSQVSGTIAFDEQVLFASYRTDKKAQYCKETLIVQEGEAVKAKRTWLANGARSEEPVWPGILHHVGLVNILNQPNWRIEQVQQWLAQWFQYLKKDLVAKYAFTDEQFTGDFVISGEYLNAVPLNLVAQEDYYAFIDAGNYPIDDIELSYLACRAIAISLRKLSSIAPPADAAYNDAFAIVQAALQGIDIQLTEEQYNNYVKKEKLLLASDPLKEKFITLKVRSF